MKPKPSDVLRGTALLIRRTGFVPGACAVDEVGNTVPPASPAARKFCVSGAARYVVGKSTGTVFTDGDGSSTEQVYLAAMDAFCRHVGVDRVMDWADRTPTWTDSEVVRTLQQAADALDRGPLR